MANIRVTMAPSGASGGHLCLRLSPTQPDQLHGAMNERGFSHSPSAHGQTRRTTSVTNVTFAGFLKFWWSQESHIFKSLTEVTS